MTELEARAMYEHAVFETFIATRVNNSNWSLSDLRGFFKSADRARLRAVGDPLCPAPTLHPRFAAWQAAVRRPIRGFSWTAAVTKLSNTFTDRAATPIASEVRGTVPMFWRIFVRAVSKMSP